MNHAHNPNPVGAPLSAETWRIGAFRRSFRFYWPVFLILALGLAVTHFAANRVEKLALENDRRTFQADMHQILQSLENRLENLVHALTRLRDFAASQWPVSQPEWESYLYGMDPFTFYEGFYDFGLLRFENGPEPYYKLFHPVHYTVVRPRPGPYADPLMSGILSPADSDGLGYTEINDIPAASDKLNFGAGPKTGFRIYIAIRKSGVEREKVLGAVFASIDIDRFFDSDAVTNLDIGFTLYSGRKIYEERRLWGKPLHEIMTRPGGAPYLSKTITFPMYATKQTMLFYTLPTFEARSMRRWPLFVLGGGATLTILLAGLFFIQGRARLKELTVLEDLRESRDQLKALITERERISRDLHDIVIQSVYGVGLGLQSCRRLLARDPDKASDRLTENLAALNSVIDQLRNFITTLRPETVHGLGLKEALEGLILTLERADTAAISLEAQEGAASQLRSEHAIHLLNIAREALSNSLRHSGANRIIMRLRRETSALVLEIEDNGKSFCFETVSRGHGLKNISSRVAEMKGQFVFINTPLRSTHLRVTIPLQNHPA